MPGFDRRPWLPAFLLIVSAATGLSAHAAGTVQLELVGNAKESAMAFQEWSQALGKAGIRNVRIRDATDADKVAVENRGTPQDPMYVVMGVVISRDELLLPGGRFRRADVSRLAKWLTDLAESGPPETRERKAAFGLNASQFEQVHNDLALPIGFATQGKNSREIVQKIADRLRLPLKFDAETAQTLSENKVGEELAGLSSGTVLAYVLQLAGYGLLPTIAGNGPAYTIVKARTDLELWPIGWKSEKTPQETLPAMFEFLNVNVQNVSAATALESIAKRLKTPVLIDHNALARHAIDPAKAMVSLPQMRTTYSIALRRLLFQAGMKFEVRCDESGMALLWITSVKH